MQEFHFPCPHCSAQLRMRDRKLVGREIPCPDCGEQLAIADDGYGELTALTVPSRRVPKKKKSVEPSSEKKRTRSENDPAKTIAAKGDRTKTKKTDAPAGTKIGSKLLSPMVFAWIAASVVTLLLIAFLLPNGASSRQTDNTVDHQNGQIKDDASNTSEDEPKFATEAERKLFALGKSLRDYHNEHGHFPQGALPGEGLDDVDRHSWIVAMVERWDKENHVSLKRRKHLAWQDALNERFVRRSQQPLLNPQVAALVGQEGYPTTHFVGVAGVGADAATLPKTHPRAGIFGDNRQTRIEDVQDGLANTMMVAGVRNNLGSWAGAGPATFRPFTAEPYINGPDGFGTTAGDSMFVLMADGSVRQISSDIHPGIIRRMAAMNDGLPLDLSVPGEPGDDPSNPDPPEVPVVDQTPPRDPIVAPKPDLTNLVQAPPVKKVDVVGALAQPIVSYSLKQPRPFSDLLNQVEEMAGVPIKVDEALLARFADRPVTLTVRDTTVGGILEALLSKVGLVIQIQPDGIQLIEPADEKASS